MIEKESRNPKIYRLRVIYFYKTDYNLLLGIKHREFIYSMNNNKFFKNGVYSNRSEYNIINPVYFEKGRGDSKRYGCRLHVTSKRKGSIKNASGISRCNPACSAEL